MEQIKSKIKEIGDHTKHAQELIQRIALKAIEDLHQVAKTKHDILKADKQELTRQYKEMQFMEMYLKQQVDKADPIDFLRLAQGHDLVKLNICKQ